MLKTNLVFKWNPVYDSLAITASKNTVHIYDKKGTKINELTSQCENQIIDLDWDSNGETIAFLQEDYDKVTVWHVSMRQFTSIEGSPSKEKCCFIKWGKNVQTLAIGTEKGVITFYSKIAKRKIPCVNKHSKKIMAADWNNQGILMTVGNDNTITFSNSSGDTIYTMADFRYDPKQIKWSTLKLPQYDKEEKVFSLVYNGNNFLIFKYDQINVPNNIEFPEKYGYISKYVWYSDGVVAIGFSNGYLQIILTGNYNEAETLHTSRMFNMHVQDMAICESKMKLAIGCLDTIKIISLTTYQELKADKITIKPNYGKVEELQWTQDGQILSVGTNTGMILNYIMYVPDISCSNLNLVTFMTSLYEAKIVDSEATDPDVETVCKIKFEKEPAALKMNAYYLIAVFNTEYIVYSYRDEETGTFLAEAKVCFSKETNSTIISLQCNEDYIVTFCKSNIMVEDVREGNMVYKFLESVPMSSLPTLVTLASEFLYIYDDSGTIYCFHLLEQSLVAEQRLETPLHKLYPNKIGTKIILQDVNKDLYLWSILYNQVFHLDEKVNVTDIVFCDERDEMFIVQIEHELVPYVFVHQSIDGPFVSLVKNYKTLRDALENEESTLPNITAVERDLKLVQFTAHEAILFSASENGLRRYTLSSHNSLTNWTPEDDDKSHLRHFLQNLALYDLKEAMKSARKLDNYEVWKVFNKVALNTVDLDIAECCNLYSKNVGYVFEIRNLKKEHELNIILGKICSILNRSDQAQEYFIRSSRPEMALDMRCDLQDFKIAHKIAEKIAPQKIPNIGRKLGLQYEIEGHYNDALKIYETSYLRMKSEVEIDCPLEEHNLQCQAGIARCCIRLGNITRGITLANELRDPNVIIEIAAVCEAINQLNEAAELNEKLGNFEKAAQLYIEQKNLKKAFQYSDYIKTPKLLIKLASAKEEQGKYSDAEAAFEKAHDYENVIRINLYHLNNPEKAKHILRHLCSSAHAAEMMAGYSEEKGWKREAVEFLIVAGKYENSYLLAQLNEEMDTYASMIEQRISVGSEKYKSEFMKIAEYYEGKNEWGKAAQAFRKQDNYKKALKLYLKAGDHYIDETIDMVAQKNDQNLVNNLLNYLIGEVDNTPKEPSYLLKLYLKLKNFKQASKIALIIANGELENSNFKSAHKFLYDTIATIEQSNEKVPLELNQKFALIHSYIIVRNVIKNNDHMLAARIMIRICKNISMFTSVAANVLTTTIVECTKAKLKAEAYKWAMVAIKPEYKDGLSDNFRPKIENIAKKPVNNPDEPEITSACYISGKQLENSELYCDVSQSNLQFCYVSGMHLIKGEILKHKTKNYYVNSSALEAWLEGGNMCPITEEMITMEDFEMSSDKITMD